MSIYGLLISLAIFICASLVEISVKKDGKNKDIVWGILIAIIVPSLIGARIYHVISTWSFYSANPNQIWAVGNGGLGLWGGLFGGFLGLYVYLKYKCENLSYWLDQIALVLPLGQAIGRLGNFFNQELYGSPTTVPWAIYIQPTKRLPGFESYNTFHPLFLYEAILNIILFVLLGAIAKRHKMGNKFVFYSYLIGYSSIRFFLEYLRPMSWTIQNINVSQLICIVIFSTSVILMKKNL